MLADPICTCTGPARDAHDRDCPVRKAHPRTDLGDAPMTNPLAATTARTIITHTTACATSPGPCSCNYDSRLRAMETILQDFAREVVKGRGQPVADLAAARAALANSDRVHARECDEDDPFCLACGTTLSLRDECAWPTDGPLCDGCADDERVVFRDGLRAALTHADQLAAHVAELEEQAAARERAFATATEFQYRKSGEREARLTAEVERLTADRDESRRQWSIERDLLTEAKRALGDAHDWPDLAEGVRRVVEDLDRLRVAARRLVDALDADEHRHVVTAALDGLRDALAGRENDHG